MDRRRERSQLAAFRPARQGQAAGLSQNEVYAGYTHLCLKACFFECRISSAAACFRFLWPFLDRDSPRPQFFRQLQLLQKRITGENDTRGIPDDRTKRILQLCGIRGPVSRSRKSFELCFEFGQVIWLFYWRHDPVQPSRWKRAGICHDARPASLRAS